MTDLVLELRCRACGENLAAVIHIPVSLPDNDTRVVMDVEPCQSCVEHSRDEGMREAEGVPRSPVSMRVD